MFPRGHIEIDTRVFDITTQAVQRSPKLMQTSLKRQEPRLVRRVLEPLKTKPGNPRYPIRWKSQKQRRAFFATNGFGGGIPSTRSDELINAWKGEWVFDGVGGYIVFYNDKDYEPFVQGDEQQPFHADTGWAYDQRVFADSTPFVEDVLIQTAYTVLDPFAGVR